MIICAQTVAFRRLYTVESLFWKGMNLKISILTGLFLLLIGCTGRPSAGAGEGEIYALAYAKGFTVERHAAYTRVVVRNPWDTTKLLRTYVLVPDTADLPQDLPRGEVVRTPVRRIVAYASAHCGMLEAIGAEGQLVGVCESRYVNLDFVRRGIAEGTLTDVGEAASPNLEKIIQLEPDLLIATPIENMGYGQVEKIGVPLLEATEYLENTPLGRAEWVRLLGLFCGREAEADSVFRRIEANYKAVKALTDNVEDRPTVLPEMPYPPVWYVPGGESFMANLYRDAGADYPWSDDPLAGSLTLSIEAVLERGVGAEVWVIKYNRPQDMTLAGLRGEFDAASRFAAFQNRRVFGVNTGRTPYYDEVPIYPDRVLRDLIWVFHPELLPADYAPRYFHRLTD